MRAQTVCHHLPTQINLEYLADNLSSSNELPTSIRVLSPFIASHLATPKNSKRRSLGLSTFPCVSSVLVISFSTLNP